MNTPSASGPGTRLRAKKACETCRLRKRKCDGRHPCAACVHYEYDCEYGTQPRKRPAPGSTSAATASFVQPVIQQSSRSGSDPGLNQELMESTSGTAFPHLLGMKLNPKDAPGVHGFSWNLGPRGDPVLQFTNITGLLTEDEMERLAGIYLEQVHPVYAVVEADVLARKISQRWKKMDSIDSYDSVLCGVAALGSLYSGLEGHGRETEIVQCAKEMLEATSVMNRPLLHHATAWVLRVIYLRSTSSPHASWMASCTAMHIIEATGVHQDPQLGSLVYSDTRDTGGDGETLRRLFWVAVTLNAWIANEYGRSRVSIRGVSCKPPSMRDGDFTADLIAMYQISQQLDPDHVNEPTDLVDCLAQVEQLSFSHDALKLSQTNLALTIYRRLRVSSISTSNKVLGRIIDFGAMGLRAAVRLAEARCPWWHVANVPFQVVCTLLAMDTRESLSGVGDAMRSLKTVAQCFRTSHIQRAVDVAESLVRLSRRNKERDLDVLKDGLQEGNVLDEPSQTMWLTEETIGGNVEVDWDAFLADISLFDNSAQVGSPYQ
ncbi:hypothetical protein EYZ11_009339 [Aspergillus tanneri]|uniref:Zn(2)-C6 fungal-type domain-containing protein n=1 Tax=Aspergillus tanneri TaxID=1220188 RepID=A0A4S3J8C3_9EURO|nr:uncharacterized protein ATNIH1004_006737 [Aspergillus tanneri]KAA8645318.1 hypothetical protein ATNIH1004_006737 [Aspergillus tanneri]THC91190.1 hypothetical protein EYZ11_009339 [Aspergillus tanneri]